MKQRHKYAKPAKLELNNSGSWKRLGSFDAADLEQSALVMDAAEDLVRTLHNSEDPARCPTLRICIDEPLGAVLMRWDLQRGWYAAATGEAA